LANSGQQPAAIIKVGVEIFSPLGIELKPQFRVTIAKRNVMLAWHGLRIEASLAHGLSKPRNGCQQQLAL
jgi:hypothetical protein